MKKSGHYGENELRERLSNISGLNETAMQAARARQARLAKPPRSLGRLEDISIQLAGISGSVINEIRKKRLIVLCADNGVVREGVASAPQSVTKAQTINLTRGVTGAGALCAHFGAELQVVDVGVAEDIDCREVINRKLAYGTGTIAVEPAMSRETALLAIKVGMELSECAKRESVDIIGVGEMGIGNTTTSAAVLRALTGLPAEKLVGRGGGIDDKGFMRKIGIVSSCVQRLEVDCADVIDVISKVGGLDIAAMCGVFLGAALCRLPVVIDGLISAAAALCAYRLCPEARDFMIPSHQSCEQGYAAAMRELRLSPMLSLDMRLGEGSGCPIAFELVSAACAVMSGMASFEGAGIDDGYLDEIRRNDSYTDGGAK